MKRKITMEMLAVEIPEEERIKQRYHTELYRKYGIPVHDYDVDFTEDQYLGLHYIINDKELPKDLAERLLKYKEEHEDYEV